MYKDYPLALTQAELGLPSPTQFNSDVRNLALPEILSFATACLGVALAVYLIKSWKS
jgi:hypothetical protein